jgi:hypothetical protein
MAERASKEQKIGQLLDTLGVTMCLDEGDMVTDVVVIMKVLEQDGTVNIGMTKSEGTDWITKLGLLDAANRLEGNRFQSVEDED